MQWDYFLTLDVSAWQSIVSNQTFSYIFEGSADLS